MYQQQKSRIIAQYLLSPRCIKAYRSKPNNQFHSWKNYLNPQITELANRLRQDESNRNSKFNGRKNRQQIIQQQAKSIRYQTGTPLAYDKTPETPHTHRNFPPQNPNPNKNTYSKVQVSTNTPFRLGHKHSNSTATQQTSLMKKHSTPISGQFQFSALKSGENSIRKSSDGTIDQVEGLGSMKEFKRFTREEDRVQDVEKEVVKKQEKGVMANQLDFYHMELKEAERMYLMNKFIEHYQGVHRYKI